MKIQASFDLGWQIVLDDDRFTIDPVLFILLDGIRRGGYLRYAAQEAGVSYRHAWGMLHDWELRLGKPLVLLRRGKGARLTEAGRTLLETYHGTKDQTQRKLKELEFWAAARLETVFDSASLSCNVASSHCNAVRQLVLSLSTAKVDVVLDTIGSVGALGRYSRSQADVAGFHLPLGKLGRVLAPSMLGLLNPDRDQLYFLERRTLGLISQRLNACRDFESLVTDRYVFVNRQPGSGTRLIFDELLGAAGISCDDVRGYENHEHTHSAVAALVACGEADVGFGTEDAANGMNLHFEPSVDEHVYVAVRRDLADEINTLIRTFCSEIPKATDLCSKAPTLEAIRHLHDAAA